MRILACVIVFVVSGLLFVGWQHTYFFGKIVLSEKEFSKKSQQNADKQPILKKTKAAFDLFTPPERSEGKDRVPCRSLFTWQLESMEHKPFRFSLKGVFRSGKELSYLLFDREKNDTFWLKEGTNMNDRGLTFDSADANSIQVSFLEKRYTLKLNEVLLTDIFEIVLKKGNREIRFFEKAQAVEIEGKTYVLGKIDFDKERVLLRKCKRLGQEKSIWIKRQ